MYKQKGKPHLADANVPFTPMAKKAKKEKESPIHPLRIDDLATPKGNRSHSSSDQLEIVPISPALAPRPQANEPTIGINEVKNALMLVMKFIDQIGENGTKDNKKYRTQGTQVTLAANPQTNIRSKDPEPKKYSFQTEEKRPTTRPTTTAKRNKKRSADSTEVMIDSDRIPSSSGPSSPSMDADLQERMHQMSVVLRRLENQLDDINQSSQ